MADTDAMAIVATQSGSQGSTDSTPKHATTPGNCGSSTTALKSGAKVNFRGHVVTTAPRLSLNH
jgi:hypothetical protein